MNKKRTKIVATISDKNCEIPFIRELYEAGMDVVRINSAHLTLEAAIGIIKNTKAVSDKIAVIIDTKGPEIRTTVCDTPILLKKGSKVTIIGDPQKKTTEDVIYVTYPSFASEIPSDALIMIDDGEIELRVIRKTGGLVECIVDNEGML